MRYDELGPMRLSALEILAAHHSIGTSDDDDAGLEMTMVVLRVESGKMRTSRWLASGAWRAFEMVDMLYLLERWRLEA